MEKFRTISLLAVLFMAVIIIGCEGPAGPAGKDAGVDCTTCHNESTELLTKILQYNQSQHALGDTYLRASSATCAPCHSSEGFRMKIAGQEVTGIVNPTPVNCRTCHNIHAADVKEDFDSNFDAVTEAPVTLTADMTNGAVVDFGKGNICANCHQARQRNYGLVVNGDSVTINSPYWGPHYGTQANILAGKGGFEVPGSLAYNNSQHTLVVKDGCFKCHMDEEHNHTFKPLLSACVSCHGDEVKDFDHDGVQTEITGLLQQLQDLLVNEGLITIDNEGEIHTVRGITTTANKAGALYNFRMAFSEGSEGIHNTKYTRALLTNSIEVFD